MTERVRHKKRGSTYDVVARGVSLQSGRPIVEGERLVIYQTRDGDWRGPMWARPESEFDDGRFEPMHDHHQEKR